MTTHKQAQLYRIIETHIAATGVAPSYREMAEELGLKSHGYAHALVVHLERQGFLRRSPHHAREIELTGEHKFNGHVTVRLEGELAKALAVEAIRQRISMDALGGEAIRAYLDLV